MATRAVKTRQSIGEKALDAGGNPVLRAVVQSVPWIGPLADNLRNDIQSRLEGQRAHIFFDELNKTRKVPTIEELESNELAHCVLETTRAALRAAKDAKIRRFAHLLSNYDRIMLGNTVDDYEEILGILNELTDKEFQILLLLRRNEDEDNPARKRTDSFPYPYWHDFERDAYDKGVPIGELQGYLQRLARTGCVFMVSNSQSKILARTTQTFRRLVDLVEPPENME